MTWLTGIPSWCKYTYCVNGQVTTFKMRHDFVLLSILKKEDNLTFVCDFLIIHLYKQTMNQTKYFVPLLLTFNNKEKSIYVPKSIDHFSILMLPAQHLLVNGCWNTVDILCISNLWINFTNIFAVLPNFSTSWKSFVKGQWPKKSGFPNCWLNVMIWTQGQKKEWTLFETLKYW